MATAQTSTTQNDAPQDIHPIFQANLPFTSFDDVQLTLDSFEQSLKLEKRAKGYIYVYDGRSSCPDEAKKISLRLAKYLLDERDIDYSRIITVTAGFRSETTVEFFVLLPEGAEPEPTPTLDEKDVELLDKNSPQCKQLEENLSPKKKGA